MATGERPAYRMVVGKSNIAVLWHAVSKGKGMKYLSGNLDVTNLREALKTEKTKIVKDFKTKEDHETIRVAMFDASKDKAKSNGNSPL